MEDLTQLLGTMTAYIERSNLTSRLFNSRQTRQTLAFSKDLVYCRAAAIWEHMYYNLVKPHKSLRLPVRNGPGRKGCYHSGYGCSLQIMLGLLAECSPLYL